MTKVEKIELVKRLIKKGFLFESEVACMELGIDMEDVKKELKNESRKSN